MPYTYQYPRPAVTVDAVIFRESKEKALEVLLIERAHEPYANTWALPGGFVDQDESPNIAVARELLEETGLQATLTWHQLGFWGEPGRDPRGHTISLVYWSLLEEGQSKITPADDAKDARWFEINALPPLAFEHGEIIDAAILKKNDSSQISNPPSL